MTTVRIHLGEYTQDLETVVQDYYYEIAIETWSPFKGRRRLADVGRVCFDHCKACRMLAEVHGVRFDHCKVCRRLPECWKVRFDHRRV